MGKKSDERRQAMRQSMGHADRADDQYFMASSEGPRLIGCNYWGTDRERSGFFMVSVNGGAFRLIVPDSQASCIADIRTGRQAVVTHGFHPVLGKTAYEFMFDDESNAPFCLWLEPGQFDRPFSIADAASKERQLIVYVRGCVEVARLPVFFREAQTLPCLKPWVKG